MGKVKRQARKNSNHHDNPGNNRTTVVRRQHSQKAPQKTPQQTKKSASKNGARPVRVKVSFTKHDNVLLVGEGDFSFARSLKLHHHTNRLTATCFDSKEGLESKYPNVRRTIERLQGSQSLTEDERRDTNEVEWEGYSPSPPSSPVHRPDEDAEVGSKSSPVAVLYAIDATKLSTTHKKALRPYSPFTKIAFNFPHVGGLSTDVNRQVRYNQELLVGFFKAAKGLLCSPARPAKLLSARTDEDGDELTE